MTARGGARGVAGIPPGAQNLIPDLGPPGATIYCPDVQGYATNKRLGRGCRWAHWPHYSSLSQGVCCKVASGPAEAPSGGPWPCPWSWAAAPPKPPPLPPMWAPCCAGAHPQPTTGFARLVGLLPGSCPIRIQSCLPGHVSRPNRGRGDLLPPQGQGRGPERVRRCPGCLAGLPQHSLCST